jgi:hypothetical protein
MKVQYKPQNLAPGILYLAEEFGAVAHLCACGCGAIVRTPLDDTEWSLEQTEEGPSLNPSVGNWQEPCQSHYWIVRGKVIWAPKWSAEEINAGRRREQTRRSQYYKALEKKPSRLRNVWKYLKSLRGTLSWRSIKRHGRRRGRHPGDTDR